MPSEITVRKRKKPVLAGILAGLTALILLAVWVNALLKKPLAEAAEQRVREKVELALDTAVARALETGAEFNILSTTRMGEESFVINADTLALNRIVSLVTLNASELVSDMGGVGAEVGLFEAGGAALLSGGGPRIRARFTPVGAVSARPVSSLTSSGINQCLYSLSLVLTADVRVLVAGKTLSLTVKNTVPIAETVIVGAAPQVYTNVASEEDMLNLIPTEVP